MALAIDKDYISCLKKIQKQEDITVSNKEMVEIDSDEDGDISGMGSFAQ